MATKINILHFIIDIINTPTRLTIPGQPRVFFRREKGTDCPHRTENGVKRGTIFIRKGISRGCGVKSTGVFTRNTSDYRQHLLEPHALPP